MSPNFDKKLILQLKGSWVLAGTLGLLHTGALVIVTNMPVSWALRLVLLGIVALSLHSSLVRYALHKGERTIRWAEVCPDGEWYLGLGNTETVGPCFARGHYAKPWLIIVRLAYPGKRWPLSLVVTPDAVDNDVFNNLQIRLNLQGRDD